jgi:hypothetical protein
MRNFGIKQNPNILFFEGNLNIVVERTVGNEIEADFDH